MGSLTRLELTAVLPEDDILTVFHPPRIMLSHLKSLYIEKASITTCINFLNRLTHPALLSFQFDLFTQDSVLSTKSILQALGTALRDLPIQPIRWLGLTESWRDTVLLEIWDEAQQEGKPCRGRGGTVNLWLARDVLRLVTNCFDPMRMTKAILDTLPLQALEYLSVSGTKMDLDKAEWRGLFGGLQVLSKIMLGYGSWSLLNALHPEPEERADSDQVVSNRSQCFPALRAVKLRKMWTGCQEFQIGLDQVTEFIKARGIQELELDNCTYLEDEDISRLEPFVGRLVWKQFKLDFSLDNGL